MNRTGHESSAITNREFRTGWNGNESPFIWINFSMKPIFTWTKLSNQLVVYELKKNLTTSTYVGVSIQYSERYFFIKNLQQRIWLVTRIFSNPTFVLISSFQSYPSIESQLIVYIHMSIMWKIVYASDNSAR